MEKRAIIDWIIHKNNVIFLFSFLLLRHSFLPSSRSSPIAHPPFPTSFFSTNLISIETTVYFKVDCVCIISIDCHFMLKVQKRKNASFLLLFSRSTNFVWKQAKQLCSYQFEPKLNLNENVKTNESRTPPMCQSQWLCGCVFLFWSVRFWFRLSTNKLLIEQR